MSRSVL